MCYSADGKCVLAAGRSKNVCIYSIADQILIKKFEISCNMSFDGMEVSCMLGNFSCFLCRLLTFFFKKFFQNFYQSVKQFGSKSDIIARM